MDSQIDQIWIFMQSLIHVKLPHNIHNQTMPDLCSLAQPSQPFRPLEFQPTEYIYARVCGYKVQLMNENLMSKTNKNEKAN